MVNGTGVFELKLIWVIYSWLRTYPGPPRALRFWKFLILSRESDVELCLSRATHYNNFFGVWIFGASWICKEILDRVQDDESFVMSSKANSEATAH